MKVCQESEWCTDDRSISEPVTIGFSFSLGLVLFA